MTRQNGLVLTCPKKLCLICQGVLVLTRQSGLVLTRQCLYTRYPGILLVFLVTDINDGCPPSRGKSAVNIASHLPLNLEMLLFAVPRPCPSLRDPFAVCRRIRFMVFNEENYPNMVRLFEDLGVGAEKTDMSFR